MQKYYFRTFGCKLNQADSASVRGVLLGKGMQEAVAPEEADLIVVNTCTVTNKADQGARQQIRRLKRMAPGSKILVTGCYAERDAQLLDSMPEVDRVFGLTQKKELFQHLTGYAPENEIDFGGLQFESHFGEKSRAYLKVQEGCDMKCTFCVIRVVRGQSRSLDTGEIIRRIKMLKDQGFAEVVLTGIHLGLWGRDLGIKGVGKGMLHLLRRIAEEPDMPQIRLNSLEPYVIKPELLQLMSHADCFAHHLHLSIQSGSERILRLMKRRPNVAQMCEMAWQAKELMPDIGLGADVIVGFPGETEADFMETYKLMTEAPFSYGHVFGYSDRPGTEAQAMKDKIPGNIISERSARLREAIDANNLKFRQGMIGSTHPAILLQNERGEGRTGALTGNYVHVDVDVDLNLTADPSQVQNIFVTSVNGETTLGNLAC
jgi:threonylcarbamoyladenosine tRNA methylthiotransferase MtaB